jgi:hypothetical protein
MEILMNRIFRFVVAGVLTVLLVGGGVNVWAGSLRRGTVPDVPIVTTGICNQVLNFATGIVKIEVTASDTCILTATLIKDPVTIIGKAPESWDYLFPDAVEVAVTGGTVTQVNVCIPFIPDWKNKKIGETINFYFWNKTEKAWVTIPTVIVDTATPPLICGTGTSTGYYALFGK